ncbi:hypothetical protein [Streptomyces sp. UNOB3_S3]|uniref:hypothetical protein n=1 Tax=Streptomyces sp. UNOB3_S3 TaxID=2871682 RepID=UPI001E295752|nr:hypothetical protein [Streptomyces sp. UNOB3_S3]MCC3773308.1 hypothetical protein [Streptomyces sp. UNOB3_S3]
MITVHMSPDVQEVLGPFGMEQARQAAQGADCAACTKRITGRANVVVTGTNGPQVRVWFTHPGCMRSAVTELKTGAPKNPADEMRVSTLPPSGSGHGLAVLAAELVSPQFFADTPQAELTDVFAPHLQRRGFELACDIASPPPLVKEWGAVLTAAPGLPAASSLLAVVDPEGTVFFTGPVFTPTRWRRTALEAGECALYYGPAGLDPASRDFPAQHRLLETAARDGQLLAARIPCTDDATVLEAAARP